MILVLLHQQYFSLRSKWHGFRTFYYCIIK